MIGVVGDSADATDSDAAAVARRVREAGGAATVEDPETVLDADLTALVAVGEAALLAVARRRPDVPVLAVGAGRGVRSVPRDPVDEGGRVARACERLVDGAYDTREQPLLRATADGASGLAVFDVMLAARPPTMSEFGVATVDETDEPCRVRSVRADGVAVATPAGSLAYVHRAGGASLAPGTDAASVVPVAPFGLERDRWVLSYPVTLAVEREEGDVSLYADGREVGAVSPGTPVRVEPDATIDLVAVPERRPWFGDGSDADS